MSKMLHIAKRLKAMKYEIGKVSAKKIASELRKFAQDIESEAIAEGVEEEEVPELKDYRQLLTKMKTKESLNKLKLFFDSPRMRKPIRWWLTSLDKGEGAGAIDFNDMIRKLNIMLKRDYPATRFLKLVLDYGLANGPIALNRILEKGRAKVTLMREDVATA